MNIAITRSAGEGRFAALVLYVDVGAPLEQQLDHIMTIPISSIYEGSAAILVLYVDVGALLEQHRPIKAAHMRAVLPFLLCMLMSAPLWSSRSTTAR